MSTCWADRLRAPDCLELLDPRLALVRTRILDVAVLVAGPDRDVQGAADLLHEQRVLEHPVEARVHAQRHLAEPVRSLVGLDDRRQVLVPASAR